MDAEGFYPGPEAPVTSVSLELLPSCSFPGHQKADNNAWGQRPRSWPSCQKVSLCLPGPALQAEKPGAALGMSTPTLQPRRGRRDVGLKVAEPHLAAGRARPGSEHLFSLPLMRPRPGEDEVGRLEHRGKFSARCKRRSGGVSEPRGAPSSQREEGKLTPAERQGREDKHACDRSENPQDRRRGPLPEVAVGVDNPKPGRLNPLLLAFYRLLAAEHSQGEFVDPGLEHGPELALHEASLAQAHLGLREDLVSSGRASLHFDRGARHTSG